MKNVSEKYMGFSVEQALADPAAGRLAKPTPGQIEWADMEQEMFVHFGIATWKGQEYDSDGQFDLSKMNPKGFDPGQLCAVARSFGAKQIILVCKHVGGFCWWPTETTDYCVRNIPWKDGKGNLVKEVADACRQNGLKMGIYIYSDDVRYSKAIGRGGRTDDPAKQEEWNQKLRQQWTEVLTICGPDLVREVWFDGGCIVPLKDILDKLAPDAEIFAGPFETIRWPSTESGKLPYPCWSSVAANVYSAGGGDAAATGDPDGPKWCPPECDTILYGRGGHNWFWSAVNESRRRTLDELMDVYLKSVGRGGVLLLNSTPNTDGRIPVGDVERYQEFGAEIRRRFGKPVARTSGVGETLELDLGGLRKVNQSWIMEDTRGGHRIRAYELEGRDAAGHWQPLATGISVGHKRIDVFTETTVERLRLRITKHIGTPIIRELAVFHAEGVNAAADAPAVAKFVPCGQWAAGVERVTFDLTPHIKMPAAYEIALCPGTEPIKIRSAKLLFNSAEMPAADCVVKDGKVIVRQTQQVTAQTKTELMLEFDHGAPAGEATIRKTSVS